MTHAGSGHQLKLNKAATPDTASLLFQTGFAGRAEMGLTGGDDFTIKVSPDGGTFFEAAVCDRMTGAINFPNGAEISGRAAYHHGNIVGPVGQAGGVPNGAVIQQGSNVNGSYIRFADGTQICWVVDINMGSILAGGAGTWAEPYRTNPVSLLWPMTFATVPAVSYTATQHLNSGPLGSRALVLNAFENPSMTGWTFIRMSRMGGSNHDANISLSVMAVGRWL